MAFVRARAGRSKELGARLSSLIEPSRQACGCLHFALQHSQCDADLWLVSGFWSSHLAICTATTSPRISQLGTSSLSARCN
ncbi:antibiotic biosynthesis monooxygenase family protein [Pseudomonas protegens]|uniref:antibiotic biosynthesis monooxygenase family protein n=1 Tax=Pseudomonas protegens TaxID=380021 RepID=UPI0035CC2A0E